MKNRCSLSIAGLSAFLLIQFASAQYVQDFDSLSTGAISNGYGSLNHTVTDGNPVLKTGGSSGVREIVDESGNQFVRMSRSNSISQSVTIGEWITLSDAGLVTGQEYELSLEYRIGSVGTATFEDVDFRMGAAQDTGLAYAAISSVEVSLGDFSPNATHDTSVVQNYSDTTFSTIVASNQPVTSWTSYTFGNSFEYTAGSNSLAWFFSAMGIGNSASTYDAANHTYIDIDNVTISAVPEPSSFAALAGLLSFGFVALRRRSRKA